MVIEEETEADTAAETATPASHWPSNASSSSRGESAGASCTPFPERSARDAMDNETEVHETQIVSPNPTLSKSRTLMIFTPYTISPAC